MDSENTSPYALLAAPAGRGKSSLLVQWVHTIKQREDLTVIFIPVSIRFETALSSIVFSYLATKLAEFHGEKIRISSDWKATAEAYLRQRIPEDKKLLVIIDGLDEATDWKAGPDLFPLPSTEGVKILVSARIFAGDREDQGWIRRLGWNVSGCVQSITLPALSKKGIFDVLEKMGHPLDQQTKNLDLVSELYRLSKGDPLLVHLYIDALLTEGEKVTYLTPEDLKNIKPGLEGYFENWVEDQRTLWGDKDPLIEKRVQTILNILAGAIGPLMKEDLIAISQPDSELSTWVIESALISLSRFVIGDGENFGYVFSHPSLGNYFYDKLTSAEKRELEDCFLEYGRMTLQALNLGTLTIFEVSSYILQYYGAHLARADGINRGINDLVSEYWFRAWYSFEGTYSGFLNDVNRSWKHSDYEVKKNLHTADFTRQIKCAICSSSIAALSTNISPQLLALALKTGYLNQVQALAIVRQTPEYQISESLSSILPYLDKHYKEEALEVALSIEGQRTRALTLKLFTDHLPADLKLFVIKKAFEAANSIQYPLAKIWTLIALSDCIPENNIEEEIECITFTIRKYLNDYDYVRAITGLAKHLPEQYRYELTNEAFELVKYIDTEQIQVDILIDLAEYLPPNLIDEALDIARSVQINYSRCRALTCLIGYVPIESKENLIKESIKSADSIEEISAKVWALIYLVKYLPVKNRKIEILKIYKLISENLVEYDRFNALLALVEQIMPEKNTQVVSEALDSTCSIQNENSRANALADLVEHLPPNLLGKALRSIRGIKDMSARSLALSAIVDHLPDDKKENLVEEAITSARSIQDEYFQVSLLTAIAEQLKDEQKKEYVVEIALDTGRNIQDESARAESFKNLIAHVPADYKAEVVQEALETTRSIKNDLNRSFALTDLLQYLPKNMVGEILEMALSMKDEEALSRTLCLVVPNLSDTLLEKLLFSTISIKDEDIRARTLIFISAHLPLRLKEIVLIEAYSIKDNSVRAKALIGLVDHLPIDQRSGVIDEALNVLLSIRDEITRAEALTGLIRHLPEESKREVVDEVLDMTRLIQNDAIRANLLSSISYYLSKYMIEEVIEFLFLIQDGFQRANVLQYFIKDLPEELIGFALEAARSIKDPEPRILALMHFIIHSSEEIKGEILDELLTMIPSVSSKSFQVFYLSRLLEYLPDERKGEVLATALRIARSITSDINR